MRLTSFTDYGLRVLMLAGARRPERITVSEIAQCYGLSGHHLLKIVQALRRLGYLESSRGRGGGFRLALAPEQIRVGTVIRQMERDFALVDCMAEGRRQSCVIHPACRLQYGLHRALEAFLSVLDGYTLADLVRDSGQLTTLLLADKGRRSRQRRRVGAVSRHRSGMRK